MLLGPASHAADVHVSGRGACTRVVHVIAHEARLSDVLREISYSVGFTFRFESASDPLVSIDEQLAPTELLRRLVGDLNFSMEQMPDARCTEHTRIAKLFVLPDTGIGNRAVEGSRHPWQTPETAKIARQTGLNYLQSHGLAEQLPENTEGH